MTPLIEYASLKTVKVMIAKILALQVKNYLLMLMGINVLVKIKAVLIMGKLL